MSAFPRASNVSAYQSAAAHGGVAASDPHRLVTMLMDGALERISRARGCMERNDVAEKVRLLNRAVAIIGELHNSLDFSAGGPLASNLGDLYDYMCRCLLQSNATNSVRQLDEVSGLLAGIREAWCMIPVDVRNAARSSK